MIDHCTPIAPVSILRRGAVVAAALVAATLSVSAIARPSAEPPKGTPPIFSALTLAEALTANAGDGRILVVKATAEWCMPCKRMDATTWREESVVEWFRERGTAISLDVDRHRDDAQRLRIRAMPTMVAFRDGKELDRSTGYQSGEALLGWLSRVEQGETTATRLAALTARPREGDGALTMQERMGLARELAGANRFDEATDEYTWLWRNMARVEPGMAGVRGSFLIGDMQRLVAAHDGARERFRVLRDEAQAQRDAATRSPLALMDWVALNDVIGDEAATLEWFDEVRQRPDAASVISPVEVRVVRLLERHDRWADLGRLQRNPTAAVAQEAAMMDRLVALSTAGGTAGSAAGGELDPASTREMLEFARQDFREKAGRVYASLLAADRVEDAEAVATEAMRLEPHDPERMAQVLVATALRAGQPREAQRELLGPRPLRTERGAGAAEAAAAVAEDSETEPARAARRREALEQLDRALEE